MDTLRILVVSQKGGVGKSTLSANLSVWFSEKAFKSTVLLDLDPHGSSSTWIREARSSGVVTEHHVLDDFDARRWLINSRNIVRRQVNKAEVLICDLTWTSAMDPEVLYEFDLVVVPTSVSSIELSATTRFIETIGWVFSSKSGVSPTLLLCPSRVSEAELATDPFSARDFSVLFMLLPPIYNDDSVRQLFKKQFVFDVNESVSVQSYSRCAQAIQQAGTIHKQSARAVKVKFADRRFLDTHNTKLSRYMAEKSRRQVSENDVALSKPQYSRGNTADKGRKNLSGLSKILESVIGSK
jgi:cellulose biosynthesis protein BcsQ